MRICVTYSAGHFDSDRFGRNLRGEPYYREDKDIYRPVGVAAIDMVKITSRLGFHTERPLLENDSREVRRRYDEIFAIAAQNYLNGLLKRRMVADYLPMFDVYVEVMENKPFERPLIRCLEPAVAGAVEKGVAEKTGISSKDWVGKMEKRHRGRIIGIAAGVLTEILDEELKPLPDPIVEGVKI